MIRTTFTVLILATLCLGQPNKKSKDKDNEPKGSREPYPSQSNSDSKSALKQVFIVGDHVYNSIDDITISASSFLNNDDVNKMIAAWPVNLLRNNSLKFAEARLNPDSKETQANFTDFSSFESSNPNKNNQNDSLSISSPFLSIEDLVLQSSIPDADNKIRMYGYSKEMNIEVSVSETLIPQQAYYQYKNTTYNTSALVDCSFMNGGLTYSLKETTGNNNQSNYLKEGSLEAYLKQGKIYLLNNETETEISQILKDSKAINLSSITFQEIALPSDSILIGLDSSRKIYVFSILNSKSFELSVDSIFSSSNPDLNLEDIKFQKNAFAVHSYNSTIEVYRNQIKQKTSAASEVSNSSNQSIIFSLENNNYQIVASITVIDLIDFMINTETIYTVTRSGFGIIDLNLQAHKIYIGHPSMFGFSSRSTSKSFAGSSMFKNSGLNYFGIMMRNNADSIKEFFIELVFESSNELNPLINKVFLSSNPINYDMVVNGNNELVLFDKSLKRFIVWPSNIPNTVSVPINQVLISEIESVDLNNQPSSLSVIDNGRKKLSGSYSLRIIDREFSLSDISIVDFVYTCHINRDNVDKPTTATIMTLCPASNDYCIFDSLNIDPKGGSKVGLIIGIILGIVLASSIIIAALIIHKRRKNRMQQQTAATIGNPHIEIAEAPTPNENSKPFRETNTKIFEDDKNEQQKIY